jgi:hypothetical protein
MVHSRSLILVCELAWEVHLWHVPMRWQNQFDEWGDIVELIKNLG